MASIWGVKCYWEMNSDSRILEIKLNKYSCGGFGEQSKSGFGAERIPETADSVNQFNRLAFVDLAAQEADEGVQGVLFDVFGRAPNGVKNGAAGGDAAFVAHEEFEQAKFRRSEMDFSSAAKNAALGKFQGEVADSESVSARLGDAALWRADAGEHDGEGEWLGHIIVGAGIEGIRFRGSKSSLCRCSWTQIVVNRWCEDEREHHGAEDSADDGDGEGLEHLGAFSDGKG